MIYKILIWLYIIEVTSNKNRNPKLGKGYQQAYRLVWYNPLSYVTALFMIIIAFFMYGIKGMWNEIDQNPFKWN